jgi:phosphotransferase system enzyme I (PtsI)
MVCRAAAVHDRPVAVCGESAADPRAAAIFAGLGVTELSVAPRSIAAIRAAVAGFDPETVRTLANEALAAPTAERVREIASSGAAAASGQGSER